MNYVIEIVVLLTIAHLALDAEHYYQTGADNWKHYLMSWSALLLAGALAILIVLDYFS